MEKEKNALINELIRGKDLTEQLKRNLKLHSSSKDIQKVLLENILSSCRKAMSMLRDNPALWRDRKRKIEAMRSFCFIANGSRSSEGSNQSHMGVHKRRKDMQCRTEKLKVLTGNSLEGTVYDGHSWRKYGQKDINGTNFPREYFRCTNRVSHGCLATKLVQRSCEDPTILEVTYKGQHTCLQNNYIASPAMEFTSQCLKQEQDILSKSEAILNFQCGVHKTETELFSNRPSFSFDGNVSTEFAVENIFMENISPSFGSLATSGSDSTYFSSLSPCYMDNSGPSQYIYSPEVSGPAFDIQDFDYLLDSPETSLWI